MEQGVPQAAAQRTSAVAKWPVEGLGGLVEIDWEWG